MLGLAPDLPVESLPVGTALPANDERQDYLRARIVLGPGGERAFMAPAQDSSMFATLADAGALLIRPPHATPLPEGSEAPILRLATLCNG